jgi:hypothetical protein
LKVYEAIQPLGDIRAPALITAGSADVRNLRPIADSLASHLPGAVIRESHHPPAETPPVLDRAPLNVLRRR